MYPKRPIFPNAMASAQSLLSFPSQRQLAHNIREAIGEIQLHTIDTMLKNWTDHVGYCMANRGSHLNEIIFHC